MADLLALLSQASSSLGAHRGASATAAHNLQNANTPGYARQRAELAAVTEAERYGLAFLGRGAQLLGVTQARDRFLEAQIPGALAAESRSAAEATALAAFSALNNDAAGNLTQALTGFYGSLRSLSQNPADSTLRQAALDGARGLVISLHRTADSVAAARSALDDQAAGHLVEINSLARQMAELNGRIRTAQASGARPNDLLDARLRVQDRLAELTGGTPVREASGDVGLALPGGLSLVSGSNAGTLSAEPDPDNGGLLRFKITRSDGSGPYPVAPASLGGALGGTLDARDGALRKVADRLDTLAFDLATEVNEVHRGGVGLDGAGDRPLFAIPATATGAARTIALDPEIRADPGKLATASSPDRLPGDADNVFALIGTEESPLSGGLDAVGALSTMVAEFGASTSRAKAMAEHDGGLRQNLEAMRESASGVSIDEEMIEMTKAQRAFEAVSKVISAADGMLETLMKLR